MKGLLKEWGPIVLDAALMVAGFSLDHSDVLSDVLQDWYPIVQPALFVALGAFGGWGATKLWYAHREKSIESRLESLTGVQILTVVLLYKFGTEATVPSFDVCVSLEEMGLVKRLSGSGGVTVWDLAAETRRAVYSNKKLREEIDGFKVDPRMRKDGEDSSPWVVI